jgi:hypothetical protein
VRVFFGSPEDPKPAHRARDSHYWVGNECALHGFYQDIKGLGGGYIGIGSDQAYLLLGWARPRLAWLIG